MIFELRIKVIPHNQGLIIFYAFSAQSEFGAVEGRHGALADEFLNIRVPAETQFTERLLASRSVREMKPSVERSYSFK